jgi:hypothetical protein
MTSAGTSMAGTTGLISSVMANFSNLKRKTQDNVVKFLKL